MGWRVGCNPGEAATGPLQAVRSMALNGFWGRAGGPKRRTAERSVLHYVLGALDVTCALDRRRKGRASPACIHRRTACAPRSGCDWAVFVHG